MSELPLPRAAILPKLHETRLARQYKHQAKNFRVVGIRLLWFGESDLLRWLIRPLSNALWLHDPVSETGWAGVYSSKSPLDQVEEGLHSDPGIQHLDHLFETEPSLLTFDTKFVDGPYY